MDSMSQAWVSFRGSIESGPDTIAVSEASYYAGALALLLYIAAGGNVQEALAEIEMFGLDCPTVKLH